MKYLALKHTNYITCLICTIQLLVLRRLHKTDAKWDSLACDIKLCPEYSNVRQTQKTDSFLIS